MTDISNRADIEKLVHQFYEKALIDETIGHFFTNVVLMDFAKHLPIMYDFWESVLLDQSLYKGNVMQKHIQMDKIARLEKIHFERWIVLWNETIDSLFVGEKASLAKERAFMMKELMIYKIDASRKSNFIQ